MVYHHVTIQRLLSTHDPDHSRAYSPRANGTYGFPSHSSSEYDAMQTFTKHFVLLLVDFSFGLKKQASLGKIYPRLESPLIKVREVTILRLSNMCSWLPHYWPLLGGADSEFCPRQLQHSAGCQGGAGQGNGESYTLPYILSYRHLLPHWSV